MKKRLSLLVVLSILISSFYVVYPINQAYAESTAITYDFVTKWGNYGSDDGQFYDPSGVAVSPDGKVYVVDIYNSRIQVFDPEGVFITKWGSNGSGDGQFTEPRDIAFGPDGNVYVADTGNNRIQVFDPDGVFITKWGSYGSGDGQFYNPYGIALDPDGNVFVADTRNFRIQVFSLNGEFITKWGSQGNGDNQFYDPTGVDVSPDGKVYVVAASNNRVQVFSPDGGFITKWGSYGSEDGQFSASIGVEIGPDDNVYVVDRDNHRIQVFSPDGEFIAKWGYEGSGDGQFYMPFNITLRPNGYIYVADTRNNRIQVFWHGIPVEDVSLDQTEIFLAEGGIVTLIATVFPKNALTPIVTWESSDLNKAVVELFDNGDGSVTLTAVSEGTAVVTVTVNDEFGIHSAFCNVTVLKPIDKILHFFDNAIEEGTLADGGVVDVSIADLVSIITLIEDGSNEEAIMWLRSILGEANQTLNELRSSLVQVKVDIEAGRIKKATRALQKIYDNYVNTVAGDASAELFSLIQSLIDELS